MISFPTSQRGARHTQICQIPPSAQADAFQVAAAEASAVSRGRAGEQVAYRQSGMYAARVATEVVKVAIGGRHGGGCWDARRRSARSGRAVGRLGRFGQGVGLAGWREELELKLELYARVGGAWSTARGSVAGRGAFETCSRPQSRSLGRRSSSDGGIW